MRHALLLLVALAFATTAQAATWYVDKNVVGGAEDGSSWTDAFPDLQMALATADSLDEVWVAAGVYHPTAGTDRTISFAIPNGVSVFGGFAGGEANLGDRDWFTHWSALTGDIGSDGRNFDNSYNVVTMGAGSVLDGCTVRNGLADGPSNEWRRGAGIHIASDDVVVRNCLVTLNETGSSGWGAGLYTEGVRTTVEDCEISSNDALGSFSNGGGAGTTFAETTDVIFRRVVFRNNSAHSEGGGLYHGTLAEGCSFIDNECAGIGGGSNWVYTVRDCYYEGNMAGGGGGAGYGSMVEDSIFTRNSATSGGGIYRASVIQRCQIYGNTATSAGGVTISHGQIHNSVLFDNTVTSAGGAITGGSNAALATNLTIVNNTAAEGGGIWGNITVANSILWGNHAPDGPSVHPSHFSQGRYSYSLIEGSGGSGAGWVLEGIDDGHNIDADPLFTDAAQNDFHFGWDSPALGAGDDDAVVGETDVEGNPRQNYVVDLGAYEAIIVVAVPQAPLRFLKGYPNPFNPSVTIEFALPAATEAAVTIFDVAGREVRSLWDGPVATSTRLSWDGTDASGQKVATGVYYARLNAGELQESMKLVLVK